MTNSTLHKNGVIKSKSRNDGEGNTLEQSQPYLAKFELPSAQSRVNFQLSGLSMPFSGNQLTSGKLGMIITKDANGDGVMSGGLNQTDEFVELVNTTGHPIDISFLHLQDLPRSGSGYGAILHQFLNPTVLPAGGVIVVFSGGDPDPAKYGPQYTTGTPLQAQVATSGSEGIGLQFSNSALEIFEVQDSFGANLFHLELTQTGGSTMSGYSWNNVTDGQKIMANPATAGTSFVFHNQAAGAQGHASPGRRSNGQPF